MYGFTVRPFTGVRDHTWRLLINKRYLQQQHRESTVERSLLDSTFAEASARIGRYIHGVYGQAHDAACETKRDGLRKIQGIPCFSRHVPCYFSRRTEHLPSSPASVVVSWQHWPNGLYLPLNFVYYAELSNDTNKRTAKFESARENNVWSSFNKILSRKVSHFSLRMMGKVRRDGIPLVTVSKIGLARSRVAVYDPDIEQIFWMAFERVWTDNKIQKSYWIKVFYDLSYGWRARFRFENVAEMCYVLITSQ